MGEHMTHPTGTTGALTSKASDIEIQQAIIQDKNLKTICIIEQAGWGNHNRWTAPSIEDKEALIWTLENTIEDIKEDLIEQMDDTFDKLNGVA